MKQKYLLPMIFVGLILSLFIYAGGCAKVADLPDENATTTTTSSTTTYTGPSTTTTSSSTTTSTIADSTYPTALSISLNSGDTTTETRTVTAEISGRDDIALIKYYVTEEATAPSFSSSVWTTITSTTEYSNTSVPVTLSSGGGTNKTVYVHFADQGGNIASANDAIYLSYYGVDWGKSYSSVDEISAIAIGSVYVVGAKELGNVDMLLLKYDSSGNLDWEKTYDYKGSGDEGNGVATDSHGNVYITGKGADGANLNYLTVKYNSSGVLQWITTYEGGNNDVATDIVVDDSTNLFVTGYSWGGSSYDYLTVKYDSTGAQQWVATFEGGNADLAYGVAVDTSGNVFVTGSSNNGSNSDFLTVKYNSSGVQQWIATFEGGNADAAYDIIVDGSDNIYVTGSSHNGADHDYKTIKYNQSGAQQWTATYNSGSGSDIASGLAADSSNNVYVAGYRAGTTEDYFTIKYDSSGNQIWTAVYDSASTAYGSAITAFGDDANDDYGYGVAVDGSNNVYVTGYYTPDGNVFNAATIKYHQN